jgi:hypothetical protein
MKKRFWMVIDICTFQQICSKTFPLIRRPTKCWSCESSIPEPHGCLKKYEAWKLNPKHSRYRNTHDEESFLFYWRGEAWLSYHASKAFSSIYVVSDQEIEPRLKSLTPNCGSLKNSDIPNCFICLEILVTELDRVNSSSTWISVQCANRATLAIFGEMLSPSSS